MSEGFQEDRTQAVVGPSVGSTIAHYTIVDTLGRGGMGAVYLANDTKLKRKTALKFLAPEMAANEDFRTRFLREAQAAAALNHPNIVTIYEVGEHEGSVFIAMEHIDGRSLRDILDQDRLTLDQAVDIAVQVATGLNAAHNAGLVHRDIKPANIILDRDKRVRLLDFGLAKAVEEDDGLTKAGTALGTVNYMSPEQAQGAKVDGRSDIFSLGTLLFEMLAGELPFKRSNMPATMNAIVNEEPSQLQSYVTNVPAEIQTVLDKALAKRPADRYQTAEEMINDLRQMLRDEFTALNLTGLSAARRPAVTALAVLHLRNLGPPDDDFLSYGITEDLIVDLTRVGNIRVAPMRSVLKYRDSDDDLEEIAQKLKVDLILDGSIHKAATAIRVSAQLVDVRTGDNLWADRWEQPIEKLPDIKQALAQAVIDSLEIGHTQAVAAQVGEPEAKDATAYEGYLRGKYAFERKRDAGDVDIALGLFRQALKQEPDLLAARAGIAEVLIQQARFSDAKSELDSGLAEAERRELRADQALFHKLLARYHIAQSNWPEAHRSADRALTITRDLKDLAGEAEILGLLISVFQRQGKFDEALLLFDRVLEISHRLEDQQKIGEALKNMGVAYARKGEFDRALALYDEATEKAKSSEDFELQAACLSNTGNIKYFRGDLDGALDYYRQSSEIYQRLNDLAGSARQTLNMGLLQLLRGDYVTGLELLNRAVDTFSELNDRSSFALTLVNISQARLTLGEADRARRAAAKALEVSREINHPHSECDALIRMGAVEMYEGNIDAAEQHFRDGMAVAISARLTRNIAILHLELARVHYERGERDKCRAEARDAAEAARTLGDRVVSIHAKAINAVLDATEGLFFGSVRELQKLLDEARSLGDAQLEVQMLLWLATLSLEYGRSDEDYQKGNEYLQQARNRMEEQPMAQEERVLEKLTGRLDTKN